MPVNCSVIFCLLLMIKLVDMKWVGKISLDGEMHIYNWAWILLSMKDDCQRADEQGSVTL